MFTHTTQFIIIKNKGKTKIEIRKGNSVKENPFLELHFFYFKTETRRIENYFFFLVMMTYY